MHTPARDRLPLRVRLPSPCPASVDASDLVLEAGALPYGSHDLRVRVEDAAGNSTTVLPERIYTVPRPPDTAVPATASPEPSRWPGCRTVVIAASSSPPPRLATCATDADWACRATSAVRRRVQAQWAAARPRWQPDRGGHRHDPDSAVLPQVRGDDRRLGSSRQRDHGRGRRLPRPDPGRRRRARFS